MTSNIGTRNLKDPGKGLGFNTSARKENQDDQVKEILEKALKKSFAPEFLNRLDDVIIFNHLSEENIYAIIEIELKKVIERIKSLNYHITVSKKVKTFILKKGFDEKFGARPLKRMIQKYIEDIIAEDIITNNLNDGDQISLDVKNDKIIIKHKLK